MEAGNACTVVFGQEGSAFGAPSCGERGNGEWRPAAGGREGGDGGWQCLHSGVWARWISV